MARLSRLALAPLLLVLLLPAGCGQNGIFRDRGFDYLRAEPGKPLAYPEGLAAIPSQELYPVPDLEQRAKAVEGQKRKKRKKPKIEIPEPPKLVKLDAAAAEAPADAGDPVLSADRVVLTRDGNGYPVLMLDVGFDWAWQRVGDALAKESMVKVEDLDRGRAVYYVVVDGKRNSADEPWQLKLNYTANGVQVALQVDENGMAPIELAEPLIRKLKDGLTP